MTRASTHLTVSSLPSAQLITDGDTIAADGVPTYASDLGTGSRMARTTYAPPKPDHEMGVNEILVVCALKRAGTRALKRVREHMGGDGLLGWAAALSLLMEIEADPTMDDVLNGMADDILAHAGSLVVATPSAPTPEEIESTRLADVLDEFGADLDLSPKAHARAVALELLDAPITAEVEDMPKAA